MDFFEHRYGKTMSVIGTVTQIITYFGWTAAQIVAGGPSCRRLLGWPIQSGMILVALVVTFYTMLGGLWADTALDFMQMFLTCAGLIMIMAGIISSVGGLRELFGLAGAQYTTNTFALWPTAEDGYYGYFGIMAGSITLLPGWLWVWGQSLLRITCSGHMRPKNESVAVKATFCGCHLYLSFGVLSPLIGVTAYGALGAELEGAQTEFVLVSMAMKFLPPILTAVFIAALASALMSTSDSSMLAGATMFTQNIYKVFRPNVSDKTQLLLTRIGLLVSGVAQSGDCLVCLHDL